MKRKLLLMFFGCLATFIPSMGQEAKEDSTESKLKIVPTGRILADGAVFTPTSNTFTSGVTIPDIRLGAEASIDKWLIKIEVGYGGGKIDFRDLWIRYSFDQYQYLKLGTFMHQFGLQSATSSANKASMEFPIPDTFFGASAQNIGL